MAALCLCGVAFLTSYLLVDLTPRPNKNTPSVLSPKKTYGPSIVVDLSCDIFERILSQLLQPDTALHVPLLLFPAVCRSWACIHSLSIGKIITSQLRLHSTQPMESHMLKSLWLHSRDPDQTAPPRNWMNRLDEDWLEWAPDDWMDGEEEEEPYCRIAMPTPARKRPRSRLIGTEPPLDHWITGQDQEEAGEDEGEDEGEPEAVWLVVSVYLCHIRAEGADVHVAERRSNGVLLHTHASAYLSTPDNSELDAKVCVLPNEKLGYICATQIEGHPDEHCLQIQLTLMRGNGSVVRILQQPEKILDASTAGWIDASYQHSDSVKSRSVIYPTCLASDGQGPLQWKVVHTVQYAPVLPQTSKDSLRGGRYELQLLSLDLQLLDAEPTTREQEALHMWDFLWLAERLHWTTVSRCVWESAASQDCCPCKSISE